MKKILALLVLMTGCACAQQSLSFTSTLSAAGTTPTAWTTNGVNGTILPILNHTIAVVVTGSPSDCTIRLEGSLDSTNWFDLSGTQPCTSNVMFHVNAKLVPYVRANLLTWAGGTSAVISYRGKD